MKSTNRVMLAAGVSTDKGVLAMWKRYKMKNYVMTGLIQVVVYEYM